GKNPHRSPVTRLVQKTTRKQSARMNPKLALTLDSTRAIGRKTGLNPPSHSVRRWPCLSQRNMQTPLRSLPLPCLSQKTPSLKLQLLVRHSDRLVKNQRKQSGRLSVVQVRMTRPKFPSGAITNHRKMMMKVGMLRGGIIRKPPATLMRNSLRLGSQRTIKTATPVKIITKGI